MQLPYNEVMPAPRKFDLHTLMRQINAALEDSDECSDELMERVFERLSGRIPVSISRITASGQTVPPLESIPVQISDICLFLDGKYYDFRGKVSLGDIEDPVFETLLDLYVSHGCDPGETSYEWEHGSTKITTPFLGKDTEETLARLIDGAIAEFEHSILDGAAKKVDKTRRHHRL